MLFSLSSASLQCAESLHSDRPEKNPVQRGSQQLTVKKISNLNSMLASLRRPDRDQVSAVVHHGGAGTTAMGLKTGVPTAIVAFFGDQQLWGTLIEVRGLTSALKILKVCVVTRSA